MTVSELMSSPVVTCLQTTTLLDVTRLMRNRDCGCIPVLDEGGYVVGIVTDRDVCAAIATGEDDPGRCAAGKAMTAAVHTCLPGDSAADALEVMRRFHVRRVPVVDAAGRLQGLVSLDDMARASDTPGAPSAADVVSAMADICAHGRSAADAVEQGDPP
ncbi:MAG TPA: CBS domain-containing protein [Vicinamibacterales bacterium]|nr:CBS domain-containing protein [Vicinamibacterales bacterium]